jgi:eukaryotic-like serine/threonine-protein kinase
LAESKAPRKGAAMAPAAAGEPGPRTGGAAGDTLGEFDEDSVLKDVPQGGFVAPARRTTARPAGDAGEDTTLAGGLDDTRVDDSGVGLDLALRRMPLPDKAGARPGSKGDRPLAFGSYRVIREIARGGMAVVYQARHATLGRSVAIKVLHDHLVGVPAAETGFVAEAIAVSRIEHPGVVAVFDHGVDERARAYLVMELLAGDCLTARLARPPRLTIAEAAAIAIEIAEALVAAHDLGVIHRDLKPDNIILEPMPGDRLQVKLLDFGLARVRGDLTQATAIKDVLSGAARAARGAVMGTPQYMAPEQVLEPDRVDERTDVYALGCILYEMLCGVAPWKGDVIALTDPDRPPPPRPGKLEPSIPSELDRLIMSMLARSPAQRPATLRDVAAALRPLATPRELAPAASDVAQAAPPAARRGWVGLAVAAVVVAAAQVALAWSLGLLP